MIRSKLSSKIAPNPDSRVEYIHQPDNDKIVAGKLVGSRILPTNVKKWWVLEVSGPIEDRLIRWRLSPNQITIIGFVLTGLACWMMAWDQLIVAGLLVFVSGSFDFLDGRVARRTGQVTEAGGFFDSVLDRYMDGFLFLGLALMYLDSAMLYLVLLAWFGTSLTSYVRAKAESMNQECRGGAMQRPERILYIGTGLTLSGFWEYLRYPFLETGFESSRIPLVVAVMFIAVASNFVAAQRIWTVFKSLERKGLS